MNKLQTINIALNFIVFLITCTFWSSKDFFNALIKISAFLLSIFSAYSLLMIYNSKLPLYVFPYFITAIIFSTLLLKGLKLVGATTFYVLVLLILIYNITITIYYF